MGKRRNTAKTGDKALNKRNAEAREEAEKQSNSKSKDGDDSMFDDVDKFHNEQDKNFMKLDQHDDDDDGSSSDSEEGEEAVMDLGVGGESSEEDDDSEDDDDNSSQGGHAPARRQAGQHDLSSSSDDDDEDIEDVRDWGRKKSDYYHGDTADLELGQDEEDAYLEEEAVKEVQAARYEEMDEDDFMLSDDDDDDEKDSKAKKSTTASSSSEDNKGLSTSKISSIRDISKLSSKDRRKLLEKQHPGLLQILSHFSEAVQDLNDRTSVATGALFDSEESETAEAVGATPLGKKYLLTKALIQSSTALNLAMFLLLKSEESSADNDTDSSLMDTASSSLVQFHPVMKRLQEWNALDQKLKGKVEDNVEGLDDQLENLIKASQLMESMAANPEEEESGNSSAEDGDEHVGDEKKTASRVPGKAAVAAEASSSDSESSVDEEAMTRIAAHNARFGLRPNEVAQDKSGATRKRQRRAAPSDLGDDGDAGADNKGAARYLSSALNTIEQRAASKKKKPVASSEELVEHGEIDDDLRRGLDMMEEELGKASDQEDDAGVMDDIEKEGGDDDDKDFYSTITKKSKAKKAFKKSLYKVAPKYPRMEAAVEGERAISRTIMKNRGLVPHKNKLNRNPRVKKREQYRKALIKRKGTVREVRTDEGHRYGGEETGIKRGISRSRKLGTN